MRYCPNCGEELVLPASELSLRSEEPAAAATVEEGEADTVAVAAIEAVAEVAEHALDTVAEMHQAEEETERVEAVADMVEAVTEEEGDLDPAEPEPEDEPEPDEESEPDEEEEEVEPEAAPEEVQEVQEVVSEGPPQHEDSPAGPPRRGSRKVPAFRRHRAKARR